MSFKCFDSLIYTLQLSSEYAPDTGEDLMRHWAFPSVSAKALCICHLHPACIRMRMTVKEDPSHQLCHIADRVNSRNHMNIHRERSLKSQFVVVAASLHTFLLFDAHTSSFLSKIIIGTALLVTPRLSARIFQKL